MSTIPQDDQATTDENSKQPLQGYQDDFDTSKRDEFTNEAAENPPAEAMPGDLDNIREGMRTSAREDGEHGIDPDLHDDAINEIESRDEDGYRQQD